MSPDDRRHGQNNGYVAGCREECCRKAHMVYMKKWRMSGGNRVVPALGTHRRIHALERLGWSRADISRAADKDRNYAKHVLSCDVIHSTTATLIDDVYRRLSSIVPQDPERRESGQWGKHEATRRRAARLGYAPPIAWDDIDNDEQPHDVERRNRERMTAAEVVEEFDWLVSCGESEEQAAARLGVQAETVRIYRIRLAKEVAA